MSIVALWIDGQPQSETSILELAANRALQYGDGLFETMLLSGGHVRLLPLHLDRLQEGCARLGIPPPDRGNLERTLHQLPASNERQIAKLLVARSGGGRGYRPAMDAGAQCWLYLFPYAEGAQELKVRWCATRMGCNPSLAGIKHLNRLEQVLAQNELGVFDEGLMLDVEGNVISATAGNVFFVVEGGLLTPALDRCGIRGVMRRYVMEWARAQRLQVRETAVHPSDVDNASEIFITNAVRGVRSVTQLENQAYPAGPIARALMQTLAAIELQDVKRPP